MRIPDFTPSDSSFPIKLPSLHSCGAFGFLPSQLLAGTRRNPSMLKNLELLYQRLTAVKTAFRYIPRLKDVGFACNCCKFLTQF
jgi:hypothetical protein